MKKQIFIWTVVLFITKCGFSQEIIRGRIFDAKTNKPLTGVNIFTKSTGTGTITDSTGQFILESANKITVITASFVGYETKTVEVDKEWIDVFLTPSIVKFGEVVISSTRRDILLEDAPCKVTVIEKKEIENTSDATLDDFLRRIPDVNVVKSHRTEVMPREINLRGISGQAKTLLLMDGVPINGTWHGWTSLSLIPKDAIDRIEILRGPMSALYGSGAMGGVINIITDKPTKSRETIIKATYGSMNTLSGMLFQGGKYKNFGYYIGGRYYDTDGYIAAKEPESYNTNNARTDWNGFGKIMWFPDENSSLTLGLMHSDEDVERGRTYANHLMKTTHSHLTYEKKGKIGIKASVYSQFQDWAIDFDFGVGAPTYDQLIFQEKLNLLSYGELFKVNVPVGKKHNITTGVDYRHSSIEKKAQFFVGNREGDTKGKQHLASVFAQDEVKFLENKIILTIGARGDYVKSYDGYCFDSDPSPFPPIDENYDDRDWMAFSPKVGAVYHLQDKTTFRVSAGSAFSAPSLPRLYTTMQRSTRLIKGNPELDPERAFSYDIGIDHWFLNSLQGKLSIYHTDGIDFISSRAVDANTTIFDNITKVQMQGIETEVKYVITKAWSCFFGYTLNKSIVKEDNENPDTEGNFLAYIPEHKSSLGIIFDNPKLFSANAYLRYTGEVYTDIENTKEDMWDDYWTMDLVVSKAIFKYIKISFAVENLFDVHYDVQGLDDSEAPGIVFTGLLSAKF